MTRVLVPYHLDERLPELDVPASVDITIDPDLPAGDPWQRMRHLSEAVAETVAEVTRRGGRPAVFSGDCTTSLGVVAGLQRAGVRPAIVWLDAHGDVQTLETTESGYLGGMPLSLLTGYRPELMAEPLGLRPVPGGAVVLADARDLDAPEVTHLDRAGIRVRHVAELSAATVPGGPLYLHLDADVVDPGELPGLRFPAPDGPGLATVAEALERVVATGRVMAIGIACSWYPGRGAGARLGPVIDHLLTRWSGRARR